MNDVDLSRLLSAQLRANPAGIVGYVPDGTPVTVAEMDRKANLIADALPRWARRVAVHAPANLDSLAALHACWRTHRTPVPVSTAHGRSELETRARTARSEALVIFDPDGVPVVEEFDSGQEPELLDDEALVIFTSGTTGTPKGVIVAARALLRRLTPDAFTPFPTAGRTATLVFHSMSHVAVPLNVASQAHLGVPVVIPGRFTFALFVDLVHRFDVRSVRLTPTMIYDLATAPEVTGLGALEMVGSGTADLPEQTRRRFEDRYGIPITHSYASTETIGVAIETEEDVRTGNRRPGSSGRIAPGVEIRLLDPSGDELPPGEFGQLAVKSPTLLLGYLREHGIERLEQDEWYLTNDLARVDEDGFLYVLGRVDDALVCGGFNIFPARLEGALREVPGVSDAVVAAMPDDRLGQVPIAGVVADVGAELDPGMIRENLRSSLAAYEIPRQIAVIDAVPRSDTSGKVDRRALLPLILTSLEAVERSAS